MAMIARTGYRHAEAVILQEEFPQIPSHAYNMS